MLARLHRLCRRLSYDPRIESAERDLNAWRARCREQELALDERAAEIRSLTDALLLAAGARAVFNPALNATSAPAPTWQATQRFHGWRQREELTAARAYISSLRCAEPNSESN